jgi:hypothetical protein
VIAEGLILALSSIHQVPLGSPNGLVKVANVDHAPCHMTADQSRLLVERPGTS